MDLDQQASYFSFFMGQDTNEWDPQFVLEEHEQMVVYCQKCIYFFVSRYIRKRKEENIWSMSKQRYLWTKNPKKKWQYSAEQGEAYSG